jgi:hypothetical protein
MKIKWFIIAVLFPLLAVSQHGTSKVKIQAIGSVGFATGQSTAKPLIQLAGGLSYRRTFMGFGLGIDQYKFNSLPLFADIRYNFGKTEEGFVYGNIGYNIASKNQERKDQSGALSHKFYGGFYADAGIGYRLRVTRNHHLLFSAGYSQKNIREEIKYNTWCLVPPCPDNTISNSYLLGRIVAKMSWQLGR